MAIIGKIRRRSGLLIIIIGLAMLAFILGDIFGNGGGFGSSNQVTQIGKMNGEEVSIQELEKRTQYWSTLYSQSYGQAISSEQARQIAWDDITYERVLKSEMDKVGIAFPVEEFDDVRFGEGALAEFKDGPNFKDENGLFDPTKVQGLYEQLHDNNPAAWKSEERRLARKQMTEKYNRLISSALISNELEAKDSYSAKNSTVDFRYVLNRYNTIADSSLTVSDSEVSSYFNAHKGDSKFQQVAGRDIEFISFDVNPSPEDIQYLQNEIATFKSEFESEENDSIYCVVNSDLGRYSKIDYTRDALDSVQANEIFSAAIGTVVGPYDDGKTSRLLKVIGNKAKDEATVRHILIKSTDENETEMKQRADSILNAIKRGADFEEMVTKYTDDPGSKNTGGKYEWFPRGQMVPEFDAYSFDQPIGSKGVVKTNFGFHVMEVMERRSAEQRQVAELVKNIEPSSETFDVVYNEASDFSLDIKDIESFRSLATEKGYRTQKANGIRANSRNVSAISNARELVKWAYDVERKIGDISEPKEIDNRFVVAVLTGSREDGAPVLEDIKDDIKAELIKEKKAEKMEADIEGYGSLDDVANAWSGSTVQTANSVSSNNPSVPGSGSEPMVVGTALGHEAGSLLSPIRGKQGVYVIEVTNKSAVNTDLDLSAEAESNQSSLRNTVKNQVSNLLNKALGVKNDIDRIY